MTAWLPSSFDAEEREQEYRDSPDKLCKKTSGEDLEAEAVANAILARGRRGITAHSELRDYLSPSQLDLRRSREVYPQQGYPEEHLFRGMYRRVHNPDSRGTHSSNAIPQFDEDSHEH